MLKIVSGLAIVIATALLAACSSTPTAEQKGAAVEDRAASTTPPQVVRDTPIQPAVTQPTTTQPLTGSELTDPKNILSKRSIFFDYDSNLLVNAIRKTGTK